MMNTGSSLSPHSTSYSNNIICLNDTRQIETNSCISSSEESNIRYYIHDSGAMSKSKSL